MASAHDDNDDDIDVNMFTFEPTVEIRNTSLGVRVSVPASFRKVVDGTAFTNIDFYKGRGIWRLLTCKVPGANWKDKGLNKKLAMVLNKLRVQRDTEFRKSVISKATQPGLKFTGSTKPRNKVLQSLQITHADTIRITLPAVNGAASCVANFVCNDGRKNRHNQMWVELTHEVCAYLTQSIVEACDVDVDVAVTGDATECDIEHDIEPASISSDDADDGPPIDGSGGYEPSRPQSNRDASVAKPADPTLHMFFAKRSA
jgi:hypothetical protein